MDLPLVFDIALGLLFVYLILSLLASEVQEVITTLLQWRAVHLKKSIEILLLGDNSNENEAELEFVDRLYNSPLLRALNQEGKGGISGFLRRVSRKIGVACRTITHSRNVFGNHSSGPSYIPSDTFVKALLENLDLRAAIADRSYTVLGDAIDEKINLTRQFLNELRFETGEDTLLVAELEDLRHRVGLLQFDFKQGQLAFSAAMIGVIEQITQFLDTTSFMLQGDDRYQPLLTRRLPYLKQAIAVRKLEPTITDIVTATLENEQRIPRQLRENLVAIANGTQAQAVELAEELQQFEQGLKQWFDQSMDRSSGVYRRNAKGIAFLLGVAIAIIGNTDTIYILTRLSTDSLLRETIVQSADQFADNPAPAALSASPEATTAVDGSSDDIISDTAKELQDVRDAVQVALEELPLPIGWTAEVMRQQREQEVRWRLPFVRRVIGWLVTGVALSMGAPFWYNLLNKVVRVRNTGSDTREQR